MSAETFLRRSDLVYTKYYCEENIWKICEKIKLTRPSEIDRFYVVFVSNSNKTIPLWCQSAGDEDGMVIWDYHVLLFDVRAKLVYDFDTNLDFPCPWSDYFQQAIRHDDKWRDRFKRKYRLISAENYLQRFSSDRSHMRDEQGQWQQAPPPWPPIQIPDSENTLGEFISMDSSNSVSDVSTILDTKTLYEQMHIALAFASTTTTK